MVKQFETIVNLKHSIDFVTTICNNCKFETAREALKEKIETFQISDFFIQFEKRQFETFQISKYGSSKNSLKFETNINLKHHPKRARKKLKHFKFPTFSFEKRQFETFQISAFFIQFEKRQFETFQNFKYDPSKNSLKFETNINLKHRPNFETRKKN